MRRSVYILLHWYHTDQLFLAESAFYYMSAQVSDFMTLVYVITTHVQFNFPVPYLCNYGAD